MKTYLTGGAVRDTLLGLPVTERDWLVTESSAAELQGQGFRRVGRHFPVFLHPDTHEEYTLPRHSAAAGADTTAVVEEDLKRRDLTINAMALDPNSQLIDPLGGAQDLEDRILRHTPHFRDDPIRVLRLARFGARYQALGFHIAPETLALARRMAGEGNLDQAPPERVFAELAKALGDNNPVAFFELLRQTGALQVILPEVDRLFGIPQPPKYHPEIDTGIHSLMVLQQACHLSPLPEVRFAALLHDVGKGTTPPGEWPRHIAHEARGVPLIQSLAGRLRLPNQWRDLAVAASRYHLHCHRAFELRPKTIFRLLKSLDAFRRTERFEQFLIVCEADMRGRKGLEAQPYPQREFMRGARAAAMAVDLKALAAEDARGKQIASHVEQARIRAIVVYKKTFTAQHLEVPGTR